MLLYPLILIINDILGTAICSLTKISAPLLQTNNENIFKYIQTLLVHFTQQSENVVTSL